MKSLIFGLSVYFLFTGSGQFYNDIELRNRDGGAFEDLTIYGHNHVHGSDEEHTVLCSGFLPPNDLEIPEPSGFFKVMANGMTQTKFNQLIDQVEQYYAPIFRNQSRNLIFRREWSNSEVNAYASREGSNSIVLVSGGLARADETTDEGFLLVLCHEIGHHIGGVPKYTADGGWASVEGQADYYATSKCLRKIFAKEVNTWNGDVDPIAERRCGQYWKDEIQYKICVREAMGALSAANLNALVSGSAKPRFDAEDKNVVSVTYDRHPASQCRLDTTMHGSLCQVSDTVEIGNRDHGQGVCKNIPSQEYGARPRCWYKPEGGALTPDNGTPPTDPVPPTDPPPTDPPPTDPGEDPTGDIAVTPRLNGFTNLRLRNPNQNVRINFDVTNFKNAVGIYYEVSGQNRKFSNPNGVQPDPSHTGGQTIRATRGSVNLLPARQLPGWGTYEIRIIPLDATGQNAVGLFSNSAILELRP